MTTVVVRRDFVLTARSATTDSSLLTSDLRKKSCLNPALRFCRCFRRLGARHSTRYIQYNASYISKG